MIKTNKVEMIEKSNWPIYKGQDVGPLSRYMDDNGSFHMYKKDIDFIVSSEKEGYIGPNVYIHDESSGYTNYGEYYKLNLSNKIVYVKVDDFNHYFYGVNSLPKEYLS